MATSLKPLRSKREMISEIWNTELYVWVGTSQAQPKRNFRKKVMKHTESHSWGERMRVRDGEKKEGTLEQAWHVAANKVFFYSQMWNLGPRNKLIIEVACLYHGKEFEKP